MSATEGRRHRPDAETARRRRAALGDLLDHVERQRDAAIAWGAVPALAGLFVDDDDVLRDLGGVWSRAFAGQIDAVLDDHDDLADVVEDAAGRVAAARPALHSVLTAYAERPVVRVAAYRDADRLGVPAARAHAAHVTPRFSDRGAGDGTTSTVRADGRGRTAPADRRRCCWRRLRAALEHRGAAGRGRSDVTSSPTFRERSAW